MQELKHINVYFPVWNETQAFFHDILQTSTFSLLHPFVDRSYSFGDTWMVSNTASWLCPKFRDTDCQNNRQLLTIMDQELTGRVSLRSFNQKLTFACCRVLHRLLTPDVVIHSAAPTASMSAVALR